MVDGPRPKDNEEDRSTEVRPLMNALGSFCEQEGL